MSRSPCVVWVIGFGVLSVIGCGLVTPAEAAAAATWFPDISNLALAFKALMFGIGGAIVAGGGVYAASRFAALDLGGGLLGGFGTLTAALLLFVMIPTVTAAGDALGMVLR